MDRHSPSSVSQSSCDYVYCMHSACALQHSGRIACSMHPAGLAFLAWLTICCLMLPGVWQLWPASVVSHAAAALPLPAEGQWHVPVRLPGEFRQQHTVREALPSRLHHLILSTR